MDVATVRWLLPLWAKSGRGDDGARIYHPLLCHLLDVGVTARALWRNVLSASVRRALARELGLADEAASHWIAFLAATHDLGKCSVAFQAKDGVMKQRLAMLGWSFGGFRQDAPHGAISAKVLPDLLADLFGLARPVATRVATTVGGHHGVMPPPAPIGPSAIGSDEWHTARVALLTALAQALELPTDCPPTQLPNAAAMRLAGLVSVADWIGSNASYFAYERWDTLAASEDPLGEYARRAAERADHALASLGWLAAPRFERVPTFAQLFPTIKHPNPLQREAMALADRLRGPALVVIEAPTGEGKSEAALYLAESLAHTSGLAGFYFALPTQATSNQMFGRVRACLAASHGAEVVNLQLLHGHASLSAEFETLRRGGDRTFQPGDVHGDAAWDQAEPAVVAAEWFTHRKRGLLAPFGVGTIDQALLATLQTRHVFVRLLGLADKTVIFDEVHAYDTYVTKLLERLLAWLAALGSPVVLLSATLPDARRRALLAAYRSGLGLDEGSATEAHYPRMSWTSRDDQDARSLATSERGRKTVGVEWIDGRADPMGDESELVRRLADALAAGGCAAIVCNTVRRAQRVYRALRDWLTRNQPANWAELGLLHARMPFDERSRREEECLVRFGPPATDAGPRGVGRPHRAILVATQVIEQSLDLDFDLLVSDLAPADLILQRIGRLHRHPRATRPPGLGSPTVWLVAPALSGDVPVFDRGSAIVYDQHVLLRSWLALRHRTVVDVPLDVPELVCDVYDARQPPLDLSPELRLAWETTRAAHDADEASDQREATDRWLKPPGYGGHLSGLVVEAREEDAPDFHRSFQALTRLAEPSVTVVLLRPDELVGAEAGSGATAPPLDLVRRLLQRSVVLSDRRVVPPLLKKGAPASWRRSPLLRHCRVRRLDSDGSCDVAGHRLHLDPELGVTIDDDLDKE